MTTELPFLSDAHHYAITAVAVRAAQLDHYIEHTIALGLHNQDQTARFLLKNLGADRVVSLLKAVFLDAFVDEKERAVIERLMSEITRLRSERNDLFHWIWDKAEDPEGATHTSMRPFREQQTKRKTAEDIQAIADGMLRASQAVAWWGNHLHRKLHPSSPGTSGMPAHPPDFPSA